ncbi:DUF7511 domain-containing protein [Halosolutus gelatinilyticus]|uniref:DUF7511 domain-containing protein n=1 Tax=Halosolutus gelatinilyticus TaxID=2931975 RepID=UPI001FF15E9D|nr:hypothetical protein [Halosolutus gelatinilyticus]
MDGSTDAYDDRSARDRPSELPLDAPPEPHADSDVDAEPPRSDELDSVLVRYETRPDRRTVYPKDCPEDRKLTAWLSADATAFHDLQDVR